MTDLGLMMQYALWGAQLVDCYFITMVLNQSFITPAY